MATFGDFPPNNPHESQKKEDRDWERDTLRDLAFAAINEQRTRRRWGYVFKGFFALYLIAILILSYAPRKLSTVADPHTALVEINGTIAAEADASADIIVKGIRAAFDSATAKGLILRLNTPGGSPVQSGIINDEIYRLKQQRPDFPVYAVVQDMCASGGYYIAVAADQIYADKASIVGSIGVRMDGFGFTGTMEKIGVERRSLTAGENKAFLDPFMPMKDDDIKHAHEMLDTIHQQFIDVVKAGRGDRLADNDQLFSGLFWSGEQALQLGLIDGLANSSTVAREMIGAENIVDYTPRPNYLDRFAGRLGAAIGAVVTQQSVWNLQ